jgi:8-oxo-dGTP pyrophosphatase MutT (NUDIX family)
LKINELDSLIRKLLKLPGLEGEDEYLTSVVLLLLIPIHEEFHILFEKRSASIRQGGEVSLPGGRLDDHGASLQETAIRETTEEVGIPPDRIRIIGRLNSILAPIGSLVHVFAGVSNVKPEDIHINSEEVEKAFLLVVGYFQIIEHGVHGKQH